MELAKDRAEDAEAAEDVWGDEGIAGDADREGACGWGVRLSVAWAVEEGKGELAANGKLVRRAWEPGSHRRPQVTAGKLENSPQTTRSWQLK